MMKFIWLCLIWVSSSLRAESSSDPTTLRMCYEEQELAPFYMGKGPAPPSQNPGVMIEMLQMLDHAMPQVSIEFQRVPWQRCLNQLAQNLSDILIAGYQEERTKMGVYPMRNNAPDSERAIASTNYCLFTRKGSPLIWDGTQFNMHPAKPVAVPQGYTVAAFLEQYDLPLVKTNSSRSALQLLQKSLAEGAVTHCQSGDYFLNHGKSATQQYIAHSPPLIDQHGYLMFSKDIWQKQPRLVNQIWDEIAHLRKQHFSRLLKKYYKLEE